MKSFWKTLLLGLMIISMAILAGCGSEKTVNAPEVGKEWTYAGRYVLPKEAKVPYYEDLFLLDHIVADDKAKAEVKFDVYYQHVHDNDHDKTAPDYADPRRFAFTTLIRPLTADGKAFGSGVKGGDIISECTIKTKGTWAVIVKSLKILDIEKRDQVYEAKIEKFKDSRPLNKGSAAEAILQKSAPHPVRGGTVDMLNGIPYTY